MQPYFIGIAGPSGAGKTTLAEHITKNFPEVTHVRLDGFFKNLSEFPYYKQWINREAPENLYWDEMHEVFSGLRRGETVQFPKYDRVRDCRSGTFTVTPSKIVLIEGYLLFFDPRIRSLFDYRLYLHVSTDEQYRRKKQRWPEMEDAYFHEVVVPMFATHGRQGANFSHAILNGDLSEQEILREFAALPQFQKLNLTTLPAATYA